MFKIAKYYFLLNWFQKTKRNTITIMVFTLLFIVSTYMFDDLMAMTDEKLGLVIVKWISIILLLGIITFNVMQIFKAIPIFFGKEMTNKIVNTRKDKIVSKEHLVSKSDLILNKYRGNR